MKKTKQKKKEKGRHEIKIFLTTVNQERKKKVSIF
jgi:hypothetical protein